MHGLYVWVCWWNSPKMLPLRFILWNALSPAKLLLEVKIPAAPFQAKSQEQNFPQGGSRGPGVEPGGLCYTSGCPAGPGGRGLLEEGGGIGNQRAGEGRPSGIWKFRRSLVSN